MSQLLFPDSRGLAQAFETRRSKENGLHNFGPIKSHDRTFAKDLELLRKMLVTCSATDAIYEPLSKPVMVAMSFQRGFGGAQPRVDLWDLQREEDAHVRMTVEEEGLDLIRRHYLEIDDPSLRLWLHSIQLANPSSYNTLPSMSRARDTHAALAQERKQQDEVYRADDEKKWYTDDVEHLKSIQPNTGNAHPVDLYSGGALLPTLRQPLLSSRMSRKRYLAFRYKFGEIVTPEDHWDEIIRDNAYPWPEADVPRRVLCVPSWRGWGRKQQWFRNMSYAPSVDFASGRTGRGMDRDGIWSTARWIHEEGERGRTARGGRRRAASEPPPNVFTSALLPSSFHHPRVVLIFPMMKLATADRRSRRRSLSRTRIAEMFDWNTVLEAQPGQGAASDRLQNLPEEQLAEKPPPFASSADKSICAHQLEQHLADVCNYRTDYMSRRGLDGILEGAFASVRWNTVPSKACCRSTRPGSCANCSSTGHSTSRCSKPCGFCGAPGPKTIYPAGPDMDRSARILGFAHDDQQLVGQHGNLHIAPNCPVAKQNRCKCGPFPQYHVATKCPVLCSRSCGNSYPPGHFKHRSAMTCRSRCCMCGLRGHSGQRCKLTRCRCGGAHLGQDCRWKVECHVKGCDRFLCGVHCAGCGISRGQLEDGLEFCQGKCPSCLSEAEDATALNLNVDGNGQQREELGEDRDANTQQPASKRGRRRNKRKRKVSDKKKKEDKELPWYAPLQPRTRPIVTSKSGKKNTWRD